MTIEVTDHNDGTFTISWDENDPLESVFNDWTEEDFLQMLTEQAEKILSQREYYEGKEKVNPTETGGESQNSNISEATQKDWEDFWNSESEGREYSNATQEPLNTCEETFGQVYHSPEAQGSWD